MFRNKKYILFIFIAIMFCGIVIGGNKVYAEETSDDYITIAIETKENSTEDERIYVKIHPGETVKFPEIPQEIDGKQFMGWDALYQDMHWERVDETTVFYKPALIKPSYSYVLSDEDAAVIFRKKCYVVTLEADVDWKVDNTIYVDFDETKDLYTLIDQSGCVEMEKSGYIFLGWYTEPEGGEPVTYNTYVTSDMTVYAHWKVDDGKYRLLYHTNYNNDASGLYKIKWCKKVPKLPKLKREGYIFKGWFYSHYDDDPVLMVYEGVKLKQSAYIYAQWEEIVVPKSNISKVKATVGNKVKVSIKKVKKADGYQIMCSKYKKFKKKDSKTFNSKKTSKTIKINKKMKYIRVRAYRIDSAGKKVYGKWSKVKKIKKDKTK